MNLPNSDAPPNAGTPMLDGMNHLHDMVGSKSRLFGDHAWAEHEQTPCSLTTVLSSSCDAAPSERGTDDEGILWKPVLHIIKSVRHTKDHCEPWQNSTR